MLTAAVRQQTAPLLRSHTRFHARLGNALKAQPDSFLSSLIDGGQLWAVYERRFQCNSDISC